ncbi:MAG: murein biosynthesis integral membrane protein MurJ [Gammaproteobacteria bacterium]|nr:murein biosynthesis integral membrane protein MurJ [Gammaproteobacteria bacterium]
MGRKLLRSTSVVASMTMLSRVLGFIRDMVIAMIFGAGPAFDAFVIAFKIPNFMRRLFGEGAFSQAFVPVLAEYRENRSEREVSEFIGRVAGSLGLVLMLLVIIAEIAAPLIITVFAPGFVHDPTRFTYATTMLHLTFPYLLLIALTAFAGATLNTFNRFAIPAFTPVLLNVALIVAAWFLAPHTTVPIYALAWGVLAGGCIQLALQLPFLRQLKILSRPKVGFRDPGVRRIMKLMVPALYGVSVVQISLLVDNFFASFLPAGSISWLYYSDRLTYLPLGVIGVALATVVLPQLSRQHSSASNAAYSKTLDWSLRLAILIGVPCAVGLFMLAGPLITTLFNHGAFDTKDVLMTRRSLWAFSLGLPGFMLIKVLASAFYSRQNIKTPVKIATIAMIANLILNVILIHPLAHAGLALATSLAAMVNTGLLLMRLIRRQIFKPESGWWLLLLRLVLANAAMGLLICWLKADLQVWLGWHIIQRVWHLAFIIGASVCVYIAMLLLMGLRLRDLHLGRKT